MKARGNFVEAEISGPMVKRGGKNSKFFHKAMLSHLQHNKIFSLKDSQGNRVTQQTEVEQLLVNHFKGILTKPNVNRSEEIDKVCHHIPKKVSRDQNLALLKVINKDELEVVVNKIPKNKARVLMASPLSSTRRPGVLWGMTC